MMNVLESCLLRWILAALCGVLQMGCMPLDLGGKLMSPAGMGQDKLMWVHDSPMTIGQVRINALRRLYPDVGVFLSAKGRPDFLAETINQQRHYAIFYYLDRRHAYACRTLASNRRQVEFSGPYPITEKEHKMLDGLRKRSRQTIRE